MVDVWRMTASSTLRAAVSSRNTGSPERSRPGPTISLPPRGISRQLASVYIGVSVGKFDQMVSDGRMPAPKRIDGRKLWDRDALDQAFWALPDDGVSAEQNPWDAPM